MYGQRELIAEWGLLRVRDGAILEDSKTGRGHVSLSGAAPDLSSGDGWTLELDEAWKIAPGEREGDFTLRRK